MAFACAPALFAAQGANAQDAPASSDGDPLGTIVVTAQKTKSTVQTTPIAMSVYDATELRRQDIHDLQSLSNVAPDVSFRQGSDSPIVTVRGISSSDTSQIGDPDVAISTDGVYLNRPYALINSLFDIARIEVLRGPQGTLSGRNAVGGAINIVTAKPEKTNSGFASVQFGNYGTIDSEAMLNLALSDTVQVRIAGQTRDNDGYRAVPPFGRADSDHSRSGRVAVAFQPTANFHGVIEGEYSFLGGSGIAQQLVPLTLDDSGNALTSKPAIPSYTSFPSRVKPSLNTNVYSLRAQLDYDLPFATITYIGGYNKTDYVRTANNHIDYPSSFNMNEHPETINQELHIASDPKARFTWLAGGYFFRENSVSYDYVLRPGVSGAPVRGNTYDFQNGSASVAGFVNLGYKITPTLTIDGGLRYTHDYKRQSGNTYFANVTVDPVSYFASPGAGSASFNKMTYHAGLNWQATPEHLLYAKFDTGYKGGGFTNVNAYGPETVNAWEIGSKNRMLDNRLQLNISAFYEDYTGLQVSQYVTVDGEVQGTIRNAGKSRIYGVEPEIVADLGVLGQVSVNAQWLHARFVDFDYEGTQYAGNRLPQAPDLAVGAGLTKKWKASFGTFEFNVHTKYSDKYYLAYTNYGYERQGAYTQTNLNLAFSPPSAKWRIEAYMRNLENTNIVQDALANPYANAYRFVYAPPRTFGGKLSVWF